VTQQAPDPNFWSLVATSVSNVLVILNAVVVSGIYITG
jgi:hypothetical protein